MISARFDPKLFFQDAQNVALNVPGEELFGLMKRSLDLPAAWGALVVRESGAREVIKAGDTIDGADAVAVLFVRCTPVELSFHLDRLVAADGISAEADVTLRVSLIPVSGDLASFARSVLGSRRVAQAKDLVRFLEPVVRAALAERIGTRPSAELLGSALGQELADALHEALQPSCFASGLSIESSPVVRLRSESLDRLKQTRERIAMDKAEHEAASDLRRAVQQAQNAHLAHVADVVERLSTLAKESPDASLGELIKTFPDTQRGELYSALFAVEPAGRLTRWIVIAAGEELLFFDPTRLERPVRTVRIEGAPGRVRSVQSFRENGVSPMLWLGAACGVYALPSGAEAPTEWYTVRDATDVRGGFNSVAPAGGFVFASHSELGIWRWTRNESDSGLAILGDLTGAARTVRGLQHHDGFLYCAVDREVVRWKDDSNGSDAERYGGCLSTITSLLVTMDGVFAGNGDGDVLHWSDDGRDKPERIHMGNQRAVESLFALETHGVGRLFFAETSPRVQSRVVGDNFVRFYEAGGQTLRRVEVAPDIAVATNELRDRVFVWSTGSPGSAQSVIPIGSLTGRSVQDVCLLV